MEEKIQHKYTMVYGYSTITMCVNVSIAHERTVCERPIVNVT